MLLLRVAYVLNHGVEEQCKHGSYEVTRPTTHLILLRCFVKALSHIIFGFVCIVLEFFLQGLVDYLGNGVAGVVIGNWWTCWGPRNF